MSGRFKVLVHMAQETLDQKSPAPKPVVLLANHWHDAVAQCGSHPPLPPPTPTPPPHIFTRAHKSARTQEKEREQQRALEEQQERQRLEQQQQQELQQLPDQPEGEEEEQMPHLVDTPQHGSSMHGTAAACTAPHGASQEEQLPHRVDAPQNAPQGSQEESLAAAPQSTYGCTTEPYGCQQQEPQAPHSTPEREGSSSQQCRNEGSEEQQESEGQYVSCDAEGAESGGSGAVHEL